MPAIAMDEVQQVRDGIIDILDDNADIVAITGRLSQNLVPFQTGADLTRPVVAFVVVTAPVIGGCGRRRRVTMQFSAIADSEGAANQLLGIIEDALTPMAFLSLGNPIDAFQSIPPDRRGSDEDGRTDTLVVLDCTFTTL